MFSLQDSSLHKIIKEPLVHFLVIGALLFGLYALLNPQDNESAENRIVVSAGDVERLVVSWAKKWNRPPTETELQGLIDSYIREEVYYREAVALGLDRDDTVLRRRLMQKMEFLTNDLADLVEPDETALNEYFIANQDKYLLPARVSFTHVYFSSEKHGSSAASLAGKKLITFRSSAVADANAPYQGDPFMLSYHYSRESGFEIARLFGQEFAEQIFQTETGHWQGPIASSYGLHLVRISEMFDARLPELATVIDKVRTDYMFEQRQEINQNIYERFKGRYEIIVENIPSRPDAGISGSDSGKSS